ncbi:MAG: alpha/beta hydrolase [Pseudomonadota bacterium]
MWIITLTGALLVITYFYLRGTDLEAYDEPRGQSFDAGSGPSEAHRAVVDSLRAGSSMMRQGSGPERLARLRDYMDGVSESQAYSAKITPTNANGVPAEWVLAQSADPARRALYLHGGAFIAGSPKSHRNITSRFSEVTGAAVLAIDYRLMPEHRRLEGMDDCRTAYRWLLDNGPNGAGDADRLYVGGDSAGGNLTLALLAWIRDQGLRQVDAAVALSPLTDSTFGSDSLRRNLETDVMLAPMLRPLLKIPRPLLWWANWLRNRVPPSDARVSPVFGNLANLPPTLVQVSEAEVLEDDGRRYVNRAVAAGSPAQLQSWGHVVHVWQMFYPELPEACQAWDEIEAFIRSTDDQKITEQAA